MSDTPTSGWVFSTGSGSLTQTQNKLYADVKLKSYYAKEIVPVFVKSGFDVVTSKKTLGFEDAGRKVLYWNYLLRKRIHA